MANTSAIGQMNGPTLDELIANQNANQSANRNTNSGEVGKDDFMKLLVAQIKHQNPLNPSDGVQFLTQLAQFSELEQLVDINDKLSTLENSVKNPAESA